MNTDIIKIFEKDKFAAYIGAKLIEVEPGYAVVQMEINDCHLNGVNLVQGGAIFTLADFAFAAASNSKGCVTLGVNANISYFKSPQGKVLTAKATEISSHKKLCGYNVDVFDENEDLVARFFATGYIKNQRL
ncbi:PaaI family thioesterase [Petroclostridium sp. X23]|uniref:PaaI family thioesterase n=1 Tax=Petroclostridium sp. X23 TaxID=3045146 RepID=UPI0024AE16BF|nr:PaaI family thioesterase [Petroclostridium sp. X23]WHH58801.1 PaaI family thioesterase [Petroclostridium sp. X23]